MFKILFGILVIAFLFSGAGLTKLSRASFSDTSLVKVGSEKISPDEVEAKYTQAVCTVRKMGKDPTPEQLAATGVSREQILRTLVQESVIRQQTDKLGIQVSDDVLAEHIKNNPDFQVNGVFDRNRFNSILSVLCMSEQEYTRTLRGQLRYNIVINTVANSVPVNDYIAKKQAALSGETREVEIAVIPKSFKPTLTEPTDKDLSDYYFNNSYRFQIPEARDVNFFKIAKSKDSSTYDLTTKIEDALAGGSTLKEIADKLKLNLESVKGLMADDKNYSDLFLQTAFAKDKAQISDLITDEANNSYFVVEVADVRPARIPEMAEVKDKVVAAWKESNSNEQNLKYIAKMADELKSSSGSLQSFAASNGYKYQVLKGIKRNDTEAYGARLVNAAFDAQEGEVLGSFQNNDGTYKIAKLKSVKAATLTKEDEAASKIEVADAMRVEIMDEYFEALRKTYPIKRNEAIEKNVAKEKAEPEDIPNDVKAKAAPKKK